MHYNSSGGSEPCLEGRNSGEFVALPDLDVGAGLQQVFLHVVHEVVQELNLLFEVGRVDCQSKVVLLSVVVDVVNVAGKKEAAGELDGLDPNPTDFDCVKISRFPI